MSERGSALGPFLLGVAVGAALGALFAPDAGEVTRGQLKRKLRGLRDLAEEKAGELTALVSSDDDDDDEPAEAEEPAQPRSARQELEQRLADARQRRRQTKRARVPKEEEDEPVA